MTTLASRQQSQRIYLMCKPQYFKVEYAGNSWMDTSKPVDAEQAVAQWQSLVDIYQQLGHTVHFLEPVSDLPDMVFSANGAFSVDGKVFGAKFKNAERSDEANEHQRWYETHGWTNFTKGQCTNEGEGDFTYVSGPQLVLAGYGFRTELDAHRELEQFLDKQVVSLQLIDPRFYHLDTALFVLDEQNICYFPAAFSQDSQSRLSELFPHAVIADIDDALAFGLNAVSDGLNVVVPTEATGLSTKLTQLGYKTHHVDLSELMKVAVTQSAVLLNYAPEEE